MFSTETNSYLVEIATEFAAKSGKSLPENLSLSQGTANTPATKPSSHKSKSEVKHNVPDIPNPVALPSFSPPRQIPAFGYPEIRLASMGGTPASEINVNKPVTSLFDYDDEEDEDSRLEAQVKQVERDRMKASEPEIYDEVNRIQAPHTARTDQMYSAYAPQEEQHYEYDLKPKRPYEYPPEMPKSDPYSGQYQGSMNHWNMSRSQDATPTRPLHYEDNRTPNIERRGSISGQHMPYEDFVDSRGPNYDRRGSISGTEPYTSDYGRPRSSRWDNDGPQQQYSQPNFTSPRNNGSRTRDYDRYDDYDSRKRGRY